jgi:hypothetical protein
MRVLALLLGLAGVQGLALHNPPAAAKAAPAPNVETSPPVKR